MEIQLKFVFGAGSRPPGWIRAHRAHLPGQPAGQRCASVPYITARSTEPTSSTTECASRAISGGVLGRNCTVAESSAMGSTLEIRRPLPRRLSSIPSPRSRLTASRAILRETEYRALYVASVIRSCRAQSLPLDLLADPARDVYSQRIACSRTCTHTCLLHEDMRMWCSVNNPPSSIRNHTKSSLEIKPMWCLTRSLCRYR